MLQLGKVRKRPPAKSPDDKELNKVRASLTAKAAKFVRAIRQAQVMEQENQLGSSLAWYLKAQSEYPPSDLARHGIDRLTKRILPEEAGAKRNPPVRKAKMFMKTVRESLSSV